MIRINLLPEEFRRKARTPVKVLLAYWSWLSLGVASEVETERSVLQLEMDGLTPRVNYHSALENETKVYASSEKTLSEITLNRVGWTKKLDELIDIVHSGNDGVRHYIWFDDLVVKQQASSSRRGNSKGYGSLKAQGHSGSPKWNQVANYLEDIEDRELTDFIQDFSKPGSPEGTVSPPDETLIPSVNWSFPLTLQLRSPEERQDARMQNESNGR